MVWVGNLLGVWPQMCVAFSVQGYASAQKQLQFMGQMLDAVQSLAIGYSSYPR